jgi:hypothetical protein
MMLISMTEVTTASIPNRSIGEGIDVIDIDQDGAEELFLYIASTRSPGTPSFNDVAIFEIRDDYRLQPAFRIEGASEEETYPVAIHSQELMPFSPAPLQTGWLQDSRQNDFNGDGIKDLMVAGHGAEWPSSGYDDYESDDWADLYAGDSGFREGWPGGDVQVVLAGPTPQVIDVTNERAFWHQSAAGDIDGDGDADIVTGAGAKVRLFLNDGEAGFSRSDAPVGEDVAYTSPLSFGISNVELADFNGNGRDEFIIGPTTGLYYDAEPGLRLIEYDPESARYETTFLPYPKVRKKDTGQLVDREHLISDKLTIGDYDQDGDPDFLLKLSDDVEDSGPWTYIYRNDGNSEFSIVDFEPLDQKLAGEGGEFIDINGDGLLDIVYPGWPAGGSFEALLDLIFINEGGDRFTRAGDLDAAVDIQFSAPHPANPKSELSDFTLTTIAGEPMMVAMRPGEWLGEADVLLASMQVFDRRIETTTAGSTIAGGDDSSLSIGTPSDDVFAPGHGADRVLGGQGVDVARIDGRLEDYQIATRPVWDDKADQRSPGWVVNEAMGGDDNELISIERLEFTDVHVALDIDGAAGMAYRLYEASFDRSPDAMGVGFWIERLDSGMSSNEVAARFIDSAEFRALYGTDVGDGDFVETLYRNILDRAPEAQGYDWWVNELASGARSRAEALAGFADSLENRGNVAEMIATGIEYVAWDEVG